MMEDLSKVSTETMIQALVNSPAWDGAGADYLRKCERVEIEDLYRELDEAEREYYENGGK